MREGGIEQFKSILVDLNNGIMISRNGHDMGPLRVAQVEMIHMFVFNSIITHLK